MTTNWKIGIIPAVIAGTSVFILVRLYFSYRMHKDLHDDVIDEKY